MPVACHKVPYVTMEELEKITSHKELSESSSGPGSTDIADQTPCQEELEELYMDISKVAGRKPAILTLIPQYSNLFFIQSSDHLPPLLQGLYDPQNLSLFPPHPLQVIGLFLW